MIFQYVRDRKRQRIGIVVAVAPGVIGWAARRKKDKFDFTRAVEIASGRANTGSHVNPPKQRGFITVTKVTADGCTYKVDLPDNDVFATAMETIKERSFRYFKDQITR